MINKTSRENPWKQDLSQVTIEFPVKGVELKDFSVTVGKVTVKVTCTKKQYSKVIDLRKPVNKSSSVYSGDRLIVYCQKEVPEIWEGLTVDSGEFDREQLRQRRNDDWKEVEEQQAQRNAQIKQERIGNI